ncbi:MAG: HYR domain-containing protein [Marinilabiliales bacterium]|nr:HYR domain-containing protein [Marinilabiliales bacterium]
MVTVKDHELPTIICPTDLADVPTNNGECFATGVALGTPTTGDNCPGETASNNAPAQFPKGTTTVIWTVTDASGNTATCTQLVTVNDHEMPTITCPGRPGRCTC